MRTLIPRPDSTLSPKNLAALKAEAEKAFETVTRLESYEPQEQVISGMFAWDETPQGWDFWFKVDVNFTVAPLPKRTANRLAQIAAKIAALEAERAKLGKGE